MLPDASLTFIDKSFAVPSITLLSVIAVPLLYIAVLFTPSANVAIAEWLKNDVYASYATADAEADR